jgi:hypothetical protein
MGFAMSGNASGKAWPACKVGDSFMLGLNDLVGRGLGDGTLGTLGLNAKVKPRGFGWCSGARTISIWLTTHGTEFGAARADALCIGTGLQNGGV